MLPVRYSYGSHRMSITLEIEKVAGLSHPAWLQKTVEDAKMSFIHSGKETRISRISDGKMDRR